MPSWYSFAQLAQLYGTPTQISRDPKQLLERLCFATPNACLHSRLLAVVAGGGSCKENRDSSRRNTCHSIHDSAFSSKSREILQVRLDSVRNIVSIKAQLSTGSRIVAQILNLGDLRLKYKKPSLGRHLLKKIDAPDKSFVISHRRDGRRNDRKWFITNSCFLLR